jgi:hypothetical protein
VSPSEANRKQLYRVADAVVMLSMGRSVIYEQIRSGRLRSVTQGRARLIPHRPSRTTLRFSNAKRTPPDASSQKPR